MKEMNPAIYRRKCFLINLTYFTVIAAMVVLLVRYALSALLPFVVAAAAAAILRPLLRTLNIRLKLPRKATGVALTVLFYLLLALLGVVVFDRILDAVRAFLTSLPSLWSETLMPVLRSLGERLTVRLAQMNVELDVSLDELLGSMGSEISSLSSTLLGMAGNVAFSLPSVLISVIICIVSTLFMLFDWDKIMAFIYRQLSGKNSDIARKAITQAGATIRQFVVSYGLILIITFAELSVGFLIIGFDSAFLLAAVISIFDILPVVGCGGILIPWALISLVIGSTRAGVGIALLYVVITVVRNVVEPKIVGRQVGLHPLVTIMSMVIGSSLMGGVGLFGLPIALAVVNKLNKDGVIHLFRTEDEADKDEANALKRSA